MPRKSRSTGVGRGNGLGSRRSQFAEGQPSANPNGRPRKPRPKPAKTFEELIRRNLREKVEVTVAYDADGEPIKKNMRHAEALVANMMAKLAKAPLREQVQFFRHLGSQGTIVLEEPFEVSEATMFDIVTQLAEEARKELGDWDE